MLLIDIVRGRPSDQSSVTGLLEIAVGRRDAARAAITRRAPAEGNAPWCAGPLAQPLPAPLRYQHLLEGIEVLNAFARAEHDRLRRIFGQMERQPCLIAQPLIKAGRTCRPGPNERPGTARQVVTAYPEPAARALAPGAPGAHHHGKP